MHLIDALDRRSRSYLDRVQKFEVGRSIDGPITYLIGYASIIVAAVNCQQSWTFRLRPFDVFAHVRMPIKFDE